MSALLSTSIASELNISRIDSESLSYSQVNAINKSLIDCPISKSILDNLPSDILKENLTQAGISCNASAIGYDRLHNVLRDYILNIQDEEMNMQKFRRIILPLIARNPNTPTIDVGLFIALWTKWCNMSKTNNNNDLDDEENGNTSTTMLDECIDWIRTNHHDDIYWFDLIIKRIKHKVCGYKSITMTTFQKLLSDSDIRLSHERYMKIESVLRTGKVINYSSNNNIDVVDLDGLFQVCTSVLPHTTVMDDAVEGGVNDSVLIRLLRQLKNFWPEIKKHNYNNNYNSSITMNDIGNSLSNMGVQISKSDCVALWNWLWTGASEVNELNNNNYDINTTGTRTLYNLTPTSSSKGSLSLQIIDDLLMKQFATSIAGNFDAFAAIMPVIPEVRKRKPSQARSIVKSSIDLELNVPRTHHNVPPTRDPPQAPVSQPHIRPAPPKSSFIQSSSTSENIFGFSTNSNSTIDNCNDNNNNNNQYRKTTGIPVVGGISSLPWHYAENTEMSNLRMRVTRLFKQMSSSSLDIFFQAVFKESDQFIAKGTFINAIIASGVKLDRNTAELVWREVSLNCKGLPTIQSVSDWLQIIVPVHMVKEPSYKSITTTTTTLNDTLNSTDMNKNQVNNTYCSQSLANSLAQTTQMSRQAFAPGAPNTVIPSSSSSSSSSISNTTTMNSVSHEIPVSPNRSRTSSGIDMGMTRMNLNTEEEVEVEADAIARAVSTLRASRLPLAVVFRSLGSGTARVVELAKALLQPPIRLDLSEDKILNLLRSAAVSSSNGNITTSSACNTPYRNLFISFKSLMEFLEQSDTSEHTAVTSSRIRSKLEASSHIQGDPLKMLGLTPSLRQRMRLEHARKRSSWQGAPDDVSSGDIQMLLTTVDVHLTKEEVAFLTKQIDKSETSLSMGSDYYALGAAVTAIAAILSQ